MMYKNRTFAIRECRGTSPRVTVPSAPPHGCGQRRCSRQRITVPSAPTHSCGCCRCSHQILSSTNCTATRLWALQVLSSNSKKGHLHRSTAVGAAGVFINHKQCNLHRPTVVGVEGVLIKQQQCRRTAPRLWRWSYTQQTANTAACTTLRLWVLKVASSNSKQMPSALPTGFGHFSHSHKTANRAPGTAPGCVRCWYSRQKANSATCTALRRWALQLCLSNSKQGQLHHTTVVGASGALTKNKHQTVPPALHYSCGRCRCFHQTANRATCTEPRLFAL